jgi:hypothetical protein
LRCRSAAWQRTTAGLIPLSPDIRDRCRQSITQYRYTMATQLPHVMQRRLLAMQYAGAYLHPRDMLAFLTAHGVAASSAPAVAAAVDAVFTMQPPPMYHEWQQLVEVLCTRPLLREAVAVLGLRGRADTVGIDMSLAGFCAVACIDDASTALQWCVPPPPPPRTRAHR